MVAFAVLLLILLSFLVGRFVVSRHRGDYLTHEADEAEYYDEPEYAMAAESTKQPEVKQKKEWFI